MANSLKSGQRREAARWTLLRTHRCICAPVVFELLSPVTGLTYLMKTDIILIILIRKFTICSAKYKK